VETFGWATVVSVIDLAELRSYGLARIVSQRPLRLVDLTGAGLAQLGADERLVSGAYPIAQRWALALHRHPDRPDGLHYRARHDPSRMSAALYERAAPDLEAEPLGCLSDLQHRALLANILDAYRLGLLVDPG
jgi:hypothetical protein